MPEMISLRSFNLRSLTGHTRAVKAMIPIDIPAVMVEEAMAKGMVFKDEANIPTVHSTDPKTRKVAPVGKERELTIMRKMEEYVSREKGGETGLFTGANRPDAKRMGMELGFLVTAQERNKLWDDYRQHGIPPEERPLTIAEIEATAPRKGTIGVDSYVPDGPVTGGDEEMSLDEVLEATGIQPADVGDAPTESTD